jgi:hypothetical protein
MTVNAAREGYELWRPNREKAEAKSTRFIVALVLLVSAGLLALIVLGGWSRLESHSVGVISLVWAGLYVLFAFLVIGWNRGVLPVTAALAIILAIFAGIAAPAWFDRSKPGLSGPALSDDLLGLLCLVMIPVQLFLIAVAMVGFNQQWHVEEERPVRGYQPEDDGYDYEEGDEEAEANRPEFTEPTTDEESEPDAQPPAARTDEDARRPPERPAE